jgi:hypothetical protein
MLRLPRRGAGRGEEDEEFVAAVRAGADLAVIAEQRGLECPAGVPGSAPPISSTSSRLPAIAQVASSGSASWGHAPLASPGVNCPEPVVSRSARRLAHGGRSPCRRAALPYDAPMSIPAGAEPVVPMPERTPVAPARRNR